MNSYKPYQYKGETMLIQRYLNLGCVECTREEYDLFDVKINELANRQIDTIDGSNYDNYEIFDEIKPDFTNGFGDVIDYRNRKVLLYTEVFSKTDTKVIVNIMAMRNSKLWVNGKCIFINQNEELGNYFSINFHKGKNIFLYEQFSPDSRSGFIIQIKNFDFEMSDDVRALSNMTTDFGGKYFEPVVNIDPIVIISDESYRPEQSIFKFMCITNAGDISPDYEIRIYNDSTDLENSFVGNYDDVQDRMDELILIDNAKIGKIKQIDIDKIRKLNNHKISRIWMDFIFKRKQGEQIISGPYIVLHDMTDAVSNFNTKLFGKNKYMEKILSSQKNCVKERDSVSLFWNTMENISVLQDVENINTAGYYYAPGYHEYHICSGLDDSIVIVRVNVPENYDKTKLYPIMINLGYSYQFSKWMPVSELNEPCIGFDIYSRGLTGGSYIGEACVFEMLKWIRANFSVDEDRIYMLGDSSGGYATYSIIQNHTSLVAAAFPLSGYPNVEIVKNLSNIPVYQMVSSDDSVFRGKENEVKNKLKSYGNYHQYDIKGMAHNTLTHYKVNKSILNMLLSHKRNAYPNKIIFKTFRNRHLESFWIRLHGIKRGHKYAKIEATVSGNKRVNIRITNSDGFTLTLPPQISREAFKVNVNGKTFTFFDYREACILFGKGKKWAVIQEEPLLDYRKGSGILDVYLNNLRIIVPDNCAEGIMRCAKTFAHPFLNSVVPNIDVNYPVYTYSEMSDDICLNNLIIFDNGKMPELISEKCFVKCNENGYEYNGTEVTGDYIVMQSVSNPYDNKLSILVISSNCTTLFSKSLFTRRLIIPYYKSGSHPYLNNEALIFFGNRYYAVYENGDALKKVN